MTHIAYNEQIWFLNYFAKTFLFVAFVSHVVYILKKALYLKSFFLKKSYAEAVKGKIYIYHSKKYILFEIIFLRIQISLILDIKEDHHVKHHILYKQFIIHRSWSEWIHNFSNKAIICDIIEMKGECEEINPGESVIQPKWTGFTYSALGSMCISPEKKLPVLKRKKRSSLKRKMQKTVDDDIDEIIVILSSPEKSPFKKVAADSPVSSLVLTKLGDSCMTTQSVPFRRQFLYPHIKTLNLTHCQVLNLQSLTTADLPLQKSWHSPNHHNHFHPHPCHNHLLHWKYLHHQMNQKQIIPKWSLNANL